MTRALPLAACLLALLAGCAGFAPADGPPDRDPYTVEDPLEPSLANDGEFGQGLEIHQPGLTSEGIVDEDAFVRAHEEALENGSWVSRSEGFFAEANGSFAGEYVQTVFVRNGGETVSIVTRATPTETAPVHEYLEGAVTDDLELDELAVRETWIEDGVVYDRQERHDGSVSYGSEVPRQFGTSGTSAVYALSRATNVSIVSYEGFGYSISSEAAPPVYPYEATEPIEGWLAVDDDGVIRSVELTGRIGGDSDAVSYTQRTEYETDTARLEPPAWLEDARDRLDGEQAAADVTELVDGSSSRGR